MYDKVTPVQALGSHGHYLVFEGNGVDPHAIEVSDELLERFSAPPKISLGSRVRFNSMGHKHTGTVVEQKGTEWLVLFDLPYYGFYNNMGKYPENRCLYCRTEELELL